MKKYLNLVILKNGEYYRKSVITKESAKQQGEKLWKTIPNVSCVQVREDCGEDWGKDCYTRNR